MLLPLLIGMHWVLDVEGGCILTLRLPTHKERPGCHGVGRLKSWAVRKKVPQIANPKICGIKNSFIKCCNLRIC
jgi:hypothetical protein